ncbi:flagellar biosynthesis anti-sigma factor FlgM [Paenibacillus selenitireducens]|uniref:Negative regulator of flagellin synthesis n=1 Tax=Paenibacillus selenitireducens TaxID=1324314 RepID=A0A1T2X710_9BACL|nr:flagellar biosynthesis anti-sigma factor FlgM [Paenibacillus selenitireducens]OPA75664.1 flagellar biosynthesis anti-sigma factor FlgM [Paenibacillus selenitireducens]
MKINETQRIGAINQYQRNTDARQGSVNKKTRQLDEVSISPEAKEMLDAQARAVDPEHAKRIADLKQSVATGTYRVDANKIAEKLLPYFRN